jgi:hypothetical protein
MAVAVESLDLWNGRDHSSRRGSSCELHSRPSGST